MKQIDLASLLAITSERVRTNSQDGNLLSSDAMLKAVSDIRNFLSIAYQGEPLPSEIRDLSSVQLLQILYEIQKHNIQE